MINVFINNAYSIKCELTNCRERYKVLFNCIDDKLNNTINYYDESLDDVCEYLLSRDNLKMMGNIARKYMKEKKAHEHK